MKKTAAPESMGLFALSMVKCLALSFIVTFALLAIVSALISSGVLPGSESLLLTAAAMLIGAFVAGVVSVKKRRMPAILHGLILGVAITFLLMLVGIIAISTFSLGGAATKIVVTLAGAVVGSVVGNRRIRRKR